MNRGVEILERGETEVQYFSRPSSKKTRSEPREFGFLDRRLQYGDYVDSAWSIGKGAIARRGANRLTAGRGGRHRRQHAPGSGSVCL
jgi:hypothetical protein